MIAFNQATQDVVRSEQVLLADHIVELLRTHSFSERRRSFGRCRRSKKVHVQASGAWYVARGTVEGLVRQKRHVSGDVFYITFSVSSEVCQQATIPLLFPQVNDAVSA